MGKTVTKIKYKNGEATFKLGKVTKKETVVFKRVGVLNTHKWWVEESHGKMHKPIVQWCPTRKGAMAWIEKRTKILKNL